MLIGVYEYEKGAKARGEFDENKVGVSPELVVVEGWKFKGEKKRKYTSHLKEGARNKRSEFRWERRRKKNIRGWSLKVWEEHFFESKSKSNQVLVARGDCYLILLSTLLRFIRQLLGTLQYATKGSEKFGKKYKRAEDKKYFKEACGCNPCFTVNCRVSRGYCRSKFNKYIHIVVIKFTIHRTIYK